jgi:orotidine-5'-phosphate decarboxylase
MTLTEKSMTAATKRLAVALDFSSIPPALALFERLQGAAGLFKVGSELFLQTGPDGVRGLVERGAPVFLDLKFHDIPRTVAASAREAARMGADIFNVHASGGSEMMRAAAQAAREVRPKTKIIAVTILTSLPATEEQVLRLADSAHEAGLDGVVAGPTEMRALRARFGPGFLLVSPSIRPAWARARDDQKRTATPADAAAAGADYIVVGRPITMADDPVAAAARVVEEIQQGLS